MSWALIVKNFQWRIALIVATIWRTRRMIMIDFSIKVTRGHQGGQNTKGEKKLQLVSAAWTHIQRVFVRKHQGASAKSLSSREDERRCGTVAHLSAMSSSKHRPIQ